MMKKQNYYILLLFLVPNFSLSQNTIIHFSNPYFEDTPRKGLNYRNPLIAKRNEIKGWVDCGIMDFKNESAPDIHSQSSGYWNFNKASSEGNTYIGLVVRDNNSWEQISNKLSESVNRGNCYSFSIDLSKSNSYLSGSRLNGESRQKYNYNSSVILRIWGGLDSCEKLELLYISPTIDNEEWQSYEVEIQPNSDFTHMTLQAYYVDDRSPYNGNVLVDNISKVTLRGCEE